MRPVLVTGGTGTLGRVVVARLLDAGRDARVASRRPGAATAVADLRSGAGVDEAVAGADAMVHCATTSGAADVAVTRTLVDAARRADTPHLVFISIVGVDGIPLGYYRAKLAAERVIEDAGLGWTILRHAVPRPRRPAVAGAAPLARDRVTRRHQHPADRRP